MADKTTDQRAIALRATKAPNLPIAPVEYSQTYLDQLLNTLRLYFAQIDNFSQPLTTGSGGVYIGMPYGAFSSTQTQTVAVVQTPQQVTFNTTDFSNGVRLNGANDIRFEYAGIYNVQFSVQATNSDTQAHDIDIYFRKNGSPLPNSASVFTVPGTHGGQPGYMVIATNFFMEMAPNDSLEMYWVSNSTQTQLNYLPAITSPFISPGALSVILTVSFVTTP